MRIKFNSRTDFLSAHGESTDEHLELCPFCGSDSAFVENTHTPYYTAECGVCGAQGPTKGPGVKFRSARTKERGERLHMRAFAAAVTAWNVRW